MKSSKGKWIFRITASACLVLVIALMLNFKTLYGWYVFKTQFKELPSQDETERKFHHIESKITFILKKAKK